jgi:hypothetical protein
MVYPVTYCTNVTNTYSFFKKCHTVTHINTILCTPTRKNITNFNKLVSTQHHYMQISYNKFNQNKTINVKNSKRNSVTTAQIFTKLTTGQWQWVQICTNSHPNQAIIWVEIHLDNYPRMTVADQIFMKLIPACQSFLKKCISNYMKFWKMA